MPTDGKFFEKTGREVEQSKLAFTLWAGSVECNFDGLDGVPVPTIITSIKDHHQMLTSGSQLPELTSRAVSVYLSELSANEPDRCVRVESKTRATRNKPCFRISLPFSKLSVPPPATAKRACEYKRCSVDKRYLARRIRDTEELLELKKEMANVEELRTECKQQTTRISNLEQMNANLQAKLTSKEREANLAARLRAAQGQF